MGRVIGIDLGTTNSCVAVLENGVPRIIHSRQGGYTLPSVVAWKPDGQRLVGELAKRQAVTNPTRTIYGAKRLIGRKSDDPLIQSWNKAVPYEIVAAENGDAWVRMGDKTFSPQEISAIIIEEIKGIAEDYLNEEVTGAVITVPAYFNDNQRQATKDAGTIAGLSVERIINEPTAAALAYGLKREQDQKLAIFDLGGGTFDITILEKTGGVAKVLATNGDTFLGGDDFDQRLVQYIVEKFHSDERYDLRGDLLAMQRVREAAEHAKRELSSSVTTSIHLPFIASGPKGVINLQLDPIERDFVEGLTAHILDRVEQPCMTALKDANLISNQLDSVVLAGGMTRMPAVQKKVHQIFGKKPVREVNPDEIVAMGAAVQSAILSGEMEKMMLLDVTPHSLGIKVYGDRVSVVIPKNTTIPAAERKVYTTTVGSTNVVNVDIEVYQGEEVHVSDNTYLGRFSLEGLPQKDDTPFAVEVTFAIDTDGVVNVTARDKQSGKEASVKITPSSGLSERQLRRLTRARRTTPSNTP